MVLKRLRSDGTEMYQNAWSTCLAFVCWSILIRCRRIVRGNFSNDDGEGSENVTVTKYPRLFQFTQNVLGIEFL